MEGECAAAKRRLREELRARRRRTDLGDRERWSALIVAALVGHPWWREAQDIAGFVGRGDEPDTMGLLRRAIDGGKRLWLPRVIADDPPEMAWILTESIASLRPGPFGILQPTPDHDHAPGRVASFDLVLIPGLAFSRDGARIGAGYGYYDRALESVGASDAVRRIGLCFDAFLDPQEGQIPVEPHDIRMHAICTESGVVQCGQAVTNELITR
jgi:5-formyltetrahydrofolate cyclo-ligase